ncbi:zf-HC2 domain-containing protein [Sphingobium sp. LB126]|uniref:anti-sigma factor family protein n=1 Tax=Sphingobium sp. LB126 TaxID=1983755 RepID=UPI0012FE4956|nr:zf-HC2 domain-containing protein [Sphingobium sp. LB126]
MADILSFRGDPHQATEMLLPWYASGQLDEDDRAVVDAHLSQCDLCRAALERERRLKAQVAGLPVRADLGWEKLQRRLAPDRAARRLPLPRTVLTWPALTAFAAAQAALLLGAVTLFRPQGPQAAYRTLGAPAARGNGNLLIMFRPDTPEQEMRLVIGRAGARLVDGPTAAGAYVLDVAPARRENVLADLRTWHSVVLAQPIEAAP